MFSLIDFSENSDVKIVCSKEDLYYKMTISDETSLFDYISKTDAVDKYKVSDMISNSILWNNATQKVNKGTYYAVSNGNKLYNILMNDTIISLDERILLPDNTVIEKIIHYNKETLGFTFYKERHDSTGSTHDVMEYDRDELVESGDIYRVYEAFNEIGEVLKSATYIQGISRIMDIDGLMINILSNPKIKMMQKAV